MSEEDFKLFKKDLIEKFEKEYKFGKHNIEMMFDYVYIDYPYDRKKLEKRLDYLLSRLTWIKADWQGLGW